MTSDARVDAYVAAARPFARPVLAHIRAVVRRTLPAVEETIKWGMPFFVLDGRPLCMMAAFKAHCSFGFWQGARITGSAGSDAAMGQFGQLAGIADLPDEAELARLLLQAAALSAAPPLPRLRKHTPPPDALPDDVAQALAAAPAAHATFAGFPPGQRREYLDWIGDAKRPETRTRRIAQAVAWLAEGKRRNWKYERRDA